MALDLEAPIVPVTISPIDYFSELIGERKAFGDSKQTFLKALRDPTNYTVDRSGYEPMGVFEIVAGSSIPGVNAEDYTAQVSLYFRMNAVHNSSRGNLFDKVRKTSIGADPDVVGKIDYTIGIQGVSFIHRGEPRDTEDDYYAKVRVTHLDKYGYVALKTTLRHGVKGLKKISTPVEKRIQQKFKDIRSFGNQYPEHHADYRPWIRRMVEIHDLVPEKIWHYPAMMYAKGKQPSLSPEATWCLQNLFTEQERANLEMKVGEGFPSIPTISLGMSILSSEGGSKPVQQLTDGMLELQEKLGTPLTQDAVLQKLMTYILSSTEFQRNENAAQQIIQNIGGKKSGI